MKKSTLDLLFAAFVAASLSSCATIISGTNAEVTIDSDIKDPVNITTSLQTYQNVVLPTKVQVKRKHLTGQHINITSEKYKFKDIVLESSINPVTFANILLGGLPGWGVDLITNGVSKPSQSTYFIEPIK